MSGNLRFGLAFAATAAMFVGGAVPASATGDPTRSAPGSIVYGPVLQASGDTSAAGSSSSGTLSGDWAGWDITGGSYTSVSASWTEPTVTCAPGETSYSAYWVGLDGDGSESVEQIGTSADCDAGTPSYSAWYEFYPDTSVALPRSVKAGDKLSASVKYSGSDGYTLTLTDATQKWTKTVTGSAPQGTNASAEIIAEAPSGSRSGNVLPLADFKNVTFSKVTVNGKQLDSGDGATKINMASQSGTTMATTSALKAGSFSVSWVADGAWGPEIGDQGSSGVGSSGIGSSGGVTPGTWPGGWPGDAGSPPTSDWPGSGDSTSSGWPYSAGSGGWWPDVWSGSWSSGGVYWSL